VRRAAALVTLALTAASLAACTSEPPPTGVTVAWADASRKQVKVTWSESGSQPNKITVQGVAAAPPDVVEYVPADGPDQVLIAASDFPMNGNFQVAVSIGSTAGGITSKPGLSPMFDTDGPVAPVLTSVHNPGGTAVQVGWRPGPVPEDYTPGDPLDVLASSTSYVPMVVGQGPLSARQLTGAGRSYRHLIHDVRPPYRFTVRAVNEWGTTYGAAMVADTTTTTAAIPSRSVYSLTTPIRGRVTRHRLVCRAGRCAAEALPGTGLPVVLQARSDASHPWTPAGSTRTGVGGTFYIAARSPGVRQYRAVVQNWDGSPWVAFGSSSEPGTTASRVRVWARFSQQQLNYGQRAIASVVVWPRVDTTAMLQRWNGRGWIGVKNVALHNGIGLYSFTAVLRGPFGYRFVVPAVRYGGRTVLGWETESFVLVTR
jgi:hypothetical protein